MPHDPEPYVGYLEKEMTIMGVLSAFCVGSAGLLLDKVVLTSEGHLAQHRHISEWYVLGGLALVLWASFLFYRQRSLLAWYYGQICLGIYRNDSTVSTLISESNEWETWTFYRQAFTCLFFAGFEWALGILQAEISNSIISLFLALFICRLHRKILREADKVNSDEPYKSFIIKLRHRLLEAAKAPKL